MIERAERNRDREKRLDVVLIRPAKYDDDGYVIRYWRGVLPSNTLCCLYGLTDAVAKSGRFAGRATIRIHAYDETVQRVTPEKIARRLRRRSDCVLVCLVGIQSNQFPRAADLARRFVAAGCKAMIGGFHVSGSLALSHQMPPECQELLDAGVTLVKGEVEDVWGDMLEDVIENRVRPFYDIVERPDLTAAPTPVIPPGYMRRFLFKRFGTIDTGRGCPFDCSFCTVINVQGRKMRFRSPERILQRIRENYLSDDKIIYYVITDDNFARNIYWEKIFDGLIRMRTEENIIIQFMMQLDVKAHKLPNFVRKAAEAGCTQVFIGVESLNPKNLEATAKSQNHVEDYAGMVETWHSVGIQVHAAYITGMPYDTPESIVADAERLSREIKADQTSFFMMTPLPGSRDHAEAMAAGMSLDRDLNRFDSFHAVWDHPNMSREQWFAAYQKAWERFFTTDHNKEALLRTNIHNYWGMFKGLLWYRGAMIESAHPLLTGFFRIKDRKERRPGYPIDSLWVHWRRRWREVKTLLKGWGKLFFEMQELWLQTRIPTEKAKTSGAWRESLGEYLSELKRRLHSARERLNLTVGYVKTSLEQNIGALRNSLPGLSLPEAGRRAGRRLQETGQLWWHRFLERISSLAVRGVSTRRHLDRFWQQTTTFWRQRTYWRINPILVFWNFLRDVRLSFSFAFSLLAEQVL